MRGNTIISSGHKDYMTISTSRRLLRSLYAKRVVLGPLLTLHVVDNIAWPSSATSRSLLSLSVVRQRRSLLTCFAWSTIPYTAWSAVFIRMLRNSLITYTSDSILGRRTPSATCQRTLALERSIKHAVSYYTTSTCLYSSPFSSSCSVLPLVASTHCTSQNVSTAWQPSCAKPPSVSYLWMFSVPNGSSKLDPLPGLWSTHRKLLDDRPGPKLACLFCRNRKIACGPPPPGSSDPTCKYVMLLSNTSERFSFNVMQSMQEKVYRMYISF